VRKLSGLVTSALTGLALLAATGSGMAQDYPNQTVVWLAPSSAGSGFDVVARLITPKLSEILGQSVVVENVAGAGGTVGAAKVAEAKPDGYTVLMININHTAAEALRKDLSYNLLESFEPVIRFANSYYALVVSQKVEAKTLGELLDLAKAEPGKLNYASAGVGSATFMHAEIFLAAAGVKMTHIPYEGGGPALASIVAGETDFYGAPVATAMPMIEEGKVRALAVSSAKPLPLLPDVPTAGETVPGFEFGSWYGLVVPKGTPADVREKIRAAMAETLTDPDIKQKLGDLGLELFDEGPEEFGKFLAAEVATMKEVVKSAGIEPQ
jgi:tripartite-type tricarboxylate transporter receptor subunit TctC